MPGNFQILELIEKKKLDELLHGFTDVTGISSFIVDPDGQPISDEHNWTRLCSDYCRSTEEGKKRCYESDRYGGEISAKLKKRFIYPCLNAGLIDCTSPIIVGNYHIATFMCGQVLHAPIDEIRARKHALEIGIEDIDGYLHAIKKIPIVSNARLNIIVDFMEVVTKTISELALSKFISSMQSRRYLDRLINRVSDGIISIDANGRISMVNDAFRRITGCEKYEIIGTHFSKYISGDDSRKVYREILSMVQKNGQGRASIEILGAGKNNIPVQVAFAGDGDAEKSSSYVAVVRDISEEVKLAQLKEDLIGMMTHDLGNPIFSIQKAMQLLTSGVLGPLNPGQKELITLAMNTTQQLSGMVMDYLDIYRHENGKLRLRKEILDMRSIVEESIRQVKLIAKEKEISIKYEAPSEPLEFMGDRMRLTRICLNLLVNAIKCSPNATPIEVKTQYISNSDGILCDGYYRNSNNVSVRPEPGQRYVMSEIIDQGSGIKEKFQKSIFNKFFTLKYKEAGNPGGLGLGLAFCRLAVEAHRGFIWVKSPIFLDGGGSGRGSRFCFALPADAKVRIDPVGLEF